MKLSASVLLTLILTGCLDNPTLVLPEPPPSIPISQLLAAPDTILIEGRQLYLTTYLVRNFMPITPPDGSPLAAITLVIATDSAKLPASFSADAVWVIYNTQVWKSWLSDYPSEMWANRISKIAEDGPKWGPGVYVDVVVRVLDGQGSIGLLRASHQWIGRVE